MANEPIQGLRYPEGSGPADGPEAVKNLADDVVTKLNMHFPTEGAADAAVTSPTDGMERFYGTGATAVKQIRWNGNWETQRVRATVRNLTKTAAQSIPNATATVVNNWITGFGDDGNFVPAGIIHSAGVNTISVSGVYTVTASIAYASAGTGNGECQIRVNGAQVATGFAKFDGQLLQVACARTLRLTAGDEVTVVAYQTTGSALNTHTTAGFTSFSITQVG